MGRKPKIKDSEEYQMVKNMVKKLVKLNKSQSYILRHMKKEFNITWCERTLRRFLKHNNIVRYDRSLKPSDVIDEIKKELHGSASCQGYRMLWVRLRRRGILVTRDQVAAVMKNMGIGQKAPVQRRKHYHKYISEGPNYTWHIDGNDKLSKWGFYVHGCVDGYSRKLLWLKVFVTNKDPWLTGKYFIEAVNSNNCCPARVRCDPGTENTIIGKCQMFLRRNHTDSLAGPQSFYEGSSVLNQPIESFWRYFREGGIQFWIDEFKKLTLQGFWDPGNTIHQLCILFVYMPLLQIELEDVKHDWNAHRIRKQTGKDRPSGIPEELFEFPELKGGKDMGKGLEDSDVQFLTEKLNIDQDLQYLPESFIKEAKAYVSSAGLSVCQKNASYIYKKLVAFFM